MAATLLQVAGRRALTSSRPATLDTGRSHAEPCRSRTPSLHATSCYGESFASSTVARSSSTFLRRFERRFWLDVESAPCAHSRLSTQKRHQIYLAFLPCCASDQGFCPDDQHCLLSVGMPDLSRTRAPDTAASARGHDPSLPAWRLPASEGPLSSVATSPVIFVHGFAYDILSQSTVLYLNPYPADVARVDTDTMMIFDDID